MAGRLQRLDRGLLVALALALVASGPFLTRPGLPRQTDAELHVFRAAELGHALRGGAFYPRWAPDFYYGYGYPIFNYYAPLTYYLANLFDLLPGVDIVGGVKAVSVLGLALASVGAYLLGRELFGSAAGVLTAAAFTFAPYVVLIDPHARGDLAEHFAICLLPLTFYAFRRLTSGVGGRGALPGGALTLAAVVLSHALIGLVTGGLILAYCEWEAVLGGNRARAGWGLLALVLAAAVISFYWLPFVLERSAVKLNVVGPGHFDFHEHHLTLGELLAPSRVLDMGATAPRYLHNLGLAQWLLAVPGVVVVARVERERWRALLFFLLAGLVLLFLMLPASVTVWELVPGMAYLQFPWRLLGPANLVLAVCVGSGAVLLPSGRWRDPLLAAALAAILLLALPVLYPPMWSPEFGGTEPLDIIEWEKQSLALGTTSTGDFLPVKAGLGPLPAMPSLVASYAGPGPVDKVNRPALPDGVVVEIVEHGPLHDRLRVSASEPFLLRLFTFYFPGWRAYVDGVEVDIEVAGPEGFITFWVNEGDDQDVLVRFGDTPPRTAGWALSVGGGVGLAAVVLLMRNAPSERPGNQATSARSTYWLSSAIVLFIVLKTAVIDTRDDWLRYTSPPGEAWAAQHEERVDFGGQAELLGYDLPRQRVRSGGTLPVVLYWHAISPMGENYQSFVHLASPLHILWGQEDHLNPGDLPTTRWPLDRYVWDEYEVRVLPGTPPGEYLLSVGLYSMGGGYRLMRYDEQGQVLGDSAVIASVEVERPRRQPRVAQLGLTREVMARFPSGGITLLGYAGRPEPVALSDAWRITLFWRADSDHPGARTRDLILLNAAGDEVWRLSGPPADGRYPFEHWQAGEVVRDPSVVGLAALGGLEAGVYRFGVTVSGDAPLVPEGADEPFVLLGSVEFVSAKEQ